MLTNEENERLDSAAEVLLALSICGCSKRFIAAHLQVSNSTLSRWSRCVEDPKRKTSVPSSEQLVKLAALLRYQLSENLNAAIVSYVALEQLPIGAHIRHVVNAFAAETQERNEAIENALRKRAAHALQLDRAVERAFNDKRLLPESPDTLSEEPGSGSEILRAAHARAAEAAASELEASAVTKEDAEKAHQELETWRVKYRRDVLNRARNKRRRRAVTKPDVE